MNFKEGRRAFWDDSKVSENFLIIKNFHLNFPEKKGKNIFREFEKPWFIQSSSTINLCFFLPH
jgi:hypothetical protein